MLLLSTAQDTKNKEKTKEDQIKFTVEVSVTDQEATVKLQQNFQLDMSKRVLTRGQVKHWNHLP